MNHHPRLPSQCAKQTQAYNQFLRAAHRRQIAQTNLTLYARDQALPQKLSLLASLSFQNEHEIKIGFRNMPFTQQINTLCAPWKFHELSPELIRAALAHILNDLIKTLPSDITLHDWRMNTAPPKDLEIHIGGELKNQTTAIQLNIFTSANFPFCQFGQKLSLRPAVKKKWPPQLYINFPIDIAAAHIPAKDLSSLTSGDVILLSPCN